MATRIICDRCGAYVEGEGRRMFHDGWFVFTDRFNTWRSDPEGQPTDLDPTDLCSYCTSYVISMGQDVTELADLENAVREWRGQTSKEDDNA